MNKAVTFEKDNEIDMRAMAVVIAQLTKEGITFDIEDCSKRTKIVLTGGF